MARISCTIKKKIFAVATYLTDVKLLRTNAGNLIPDRFRTLLQTRVIFSVYMNILIV